MRLPVHTAEWLVRADGAPVRLVACQVSATGSYRPPVLSGFDWDSRKPPQTIMRPPVHTALAEPLGTGALTVVVVCHESEMGSYRAPVSRSVSEVLPPQTIMRAPSQTAAWRERASGAPTDDVGCQESAAGS